jgi:hypothetical protein
MLEDSIVEAQSNSRVYHVPDRRLTVTRQMARDAQRVGGLP